jgi:hypothetical protein
MKYLIIICALVSLNLHAIEIKPKFTQVKLEEFTTLELNIMPETGTQLIFPFELDNQELAPKLKLRLSNEKGFWVPTKSEDLKLIKGQNTITIIGNMGVDSLGKPAVALGNLFISVGGYNLSISLKTVFDPKLVVTNIVFNIDGKERDHMIESAVKRRMASLELEYQKKTNDLEDMAKQRSLKYIGVIAYGIKKEESFSIEKKLDTIDVLSFVDKLISYDDEYFIINFEFENLGSTRLFLESYEVITTTGKVKTNLTGEWDCPRDITKYKLIKCTYATLDNRIALADSYELKLRTNKGEGVLKW